MGKRKRKLIIFIILIILLLILIILSIKKDKLFIRLSKNIKSSEEVDLTTDDFEVKDNEKNSVNLIFTRANGIDKIKYPTGFEIICNGRKKVSIDFEVETNKEYIFGIVDSTGVETKESFITPEANIQLTKGNLNITLDDIVTKIREEINKKNIATNFIKMAIGENEAKDTTTTNVSQIFTNWKSFGDGNWGYNSRNNWIYNTKNSNYMTGYYDPNGNYENIELEFEARTTDGDDDMIGSMVRFNNLENNKYSSYLFLLDRHDNGGGIGNGAYNGINKVVNNELYGLNYITRLSCNPNNRWSRNTWQKYKFVAKGSTISAYLDGNLIATTTDDNISSGTIGFVSYSQAYTYFRNITIITTRLRALGEIINNVEWNSAEHNIIINVNNEQDSDLSEQDVTNIMNTNKIYYFALGSEGNKEQIEQFLQNINNRGKYLESSDLETSTKAIAEYLKEILTIK